MRFRLWKTTLSIVLAASSSLFAGALVHAQSADDRAADLKFECEAYSLSQQQAVCYLKVPGETLGVEFDISMPKDPLLQIKDPKKDEKLPNTSVFLQLNAQEKPSEIGLNIAYFGLDGDALGSSAYYLMKAEFKLSGVDQDDFPIIIPAKLKEGSEFYTVDSLAGQESHFRAEEDLDLPIRISLNDETSRPNPSSPDGLPPIRSSFEIRSSFRVDVDDDQKGELRGSAEVCFDDDPNSVAAEEWDIICRAKSMGIVSGNPRDDGIFFFPHQPINRAEAVKILTLGILRTFGFLKDVDFSAKTDEIAKAGRANKILLYPDIRYDENGNAPWFAHFVAIASDREIATGYPEDGTFRPGGKINNAESYRVIVETGRVASSEIANTLRRVSTRTKALDWFMKYAWTLGEFEVPYSEEYGEFTKRKDFLVMVMKLLAVAGVANL